MFLARTPATVLRRCEMILTAAVYRVLIEAEISQIKSFPQCCLAQLVPVRTRLHQVVKG